MKGRAAQSAAWKGVETVTGRSSASEAKSRPEPRRVRRGRGPLAAGRVRARIRACRCRRRMSRREPGLPLMMWGIGSDPVASMKTSPVSGSILKAWRMTTVPRSKGPTLAAVIATSAERRAVVGACQVERAGGVGEGVADSDAEPGCGRSACGRAGGSVDLRLSCLRDPFTRLAWAIPASGQKGMPASFADDSRGELDREAGELLFCVCSEQPHVEGAEASRGVVEASRDQAWMEGGQAARRGRLRRRRRV